MKMTTLRSHVVPVVLGACAALLLSASTSHAQLPGPLDHFMCYAIRGVLENAPVQLEDQFDPGFVPATVLRPEFFCNPVEKTRLDTGEVTKIIFPQNHLKWYRISTPQVPTHTVLVANQFGTNQKLRLTQPRWLAVPTQKDDLPHPESLDHFKCYPATGASVSIPVTLRDQFEEDRNFLVLKPLRFCNPTRKIHGDIRVEIQNPEAHLTCYDVARSVKTQNQFGPEVFFVRKMTLCVPSRKLLVD